MTSIQATNLSVRVLPAVQLPYTVLGNNQSTAPPLTEQAAEGNSQLCNQQRSAVLGEVIPIVFCRRISGIGGVLISPPATEARFSDNAEGDITARYHLVLAEGLINSIQVRDVFQCACRVGTFTQTYNRRAGTFVPGNFIDNSPGLEAPSYCGTGGTYEGLSTMAFSVTIPAGFDQWNRQVHCFVRGGLRVTRIFDGVVGPSNNVTDLLSYLLQKGSRVPAAQIDTASFLAAAQFTHVNGFLYNGIEYQSTNLRDWMANTLPLFLLRSSRVNGKQSLRPLLPVTGAGAIDTGPVDIAFTFTEKQITPAGFNIQYSSLADRKPFCVQVLWRQQPDDDIGLIRTTNVRYPGTAEDGPFEQHDLSRFCASENHAVKVGTYILSRRKHIDHRLNLRVKPDAFNGTLTSGDIVRVQLQRVVSTGASSVHDYLYEVEQISKAVSGEVQLQLTEFPVDADRRSVVAQEVAAAVGQGILLPTGKSGASCDVNSSSDTTVPADTSITGWTAEGTDADGDPYTVDWDEGGDEFEAGVTSVTPSRNGWWGGGGSNPASTIDNQDEPTAPSITSSLAPLAGQPLNATGGCAGGTYQWLRDGVAIAGATGSSYTPGADDVGAFVSVQTTCPDGSTSTSDPIAVATPAEYKFAAPISATVNYTTSFDDRGTIIFCNTSPITTGLLQTGSGSRGVSNVTSIRPVTFNTQPGNASVILGYGGPTRSSTVACATSPVVWRDHNIGLLSINNGTITDTAFLGGGSGYSEFIQAQKLKSVLKITSIILTVNVPGVGVIGDDVSQQGLGWYADVDYLDLNYGEKYINGVLQPFNPFLPPTP